MKGGIVNRYCTGVQSSLFVEKRKSEQKRKKAKPEQEKEGKAESENNKRVKESERGIEAGTSLLSVPNEEKHAGIIIKKPH